MSDNDNAVTIGREAWHRLRERERKSWSDWLAVGQALAIGRAASLKAAGCRSPFGKRYVAIQGEWLRSEGFSDIGQQVRCILMKCVEHAAEIEKWRAGLDEAQLKHFNHPDSIWYHFRRKTSAAPAPRRSTDPKMQRIASKAAAGRPVSFDQDMIRRAAIAIGENWTRDTFRLAVVALRAAFRNEADVLALLRAPPPIRLDAVDIDEHAAA
ncbi:hypothetical protein [Bradyrhizobium sp. AUGA SZCCT0042]|uniref:hypothetical protein n=1 Tax=Bradyrhizobium sp. AUGA SZCCT0042 TaxID=2807651 RepID=UPI001BA7A795|nr:hypothetical protein [Bradyrhizobium sp. AUGA SZCCT0042]MBR1298553.1 hypothetical protein [Bradyrhizobium sp. AUGA SZCCT0042]